MMLGNIAIGIVGGIVGNIVLSIIDRFGCTVNESIMRRFLDASVYSSSRNTRDGSQ